jgi:hypothetical protein
MLDIGWSEMAVIALVALLALRPGLARLRER